MLRYLDRYAESGVFAIATAILLLAFAEGFAQLLGFSLTGRTYSAGRLLEIATMLLVLVAVLNLRQIRLDLSKRS